MTREERNAVIEECARVAREASDNYEAAAHELFRKEGEWRLRAKALAAEEVEERILGLKAIAFSGDQP